MELTAKTRLEDLLHTYPFLLEYFKNLSPRFGILGNQFLRAAMGKLATLEQIASFGGLPLERLIKETEREIAVHAGEEVSSKDGDRSRLPADPEARLASLKEIIRGLHQGAEPDVVKARFQELIRDVDASEVARMEQQLIAEGMPQEEIKRLCDLHVKVFQDSFDRQEPLQVPAGHLLHTYLLENRSAEKILARIEEAIRAIDTRQGGKELRARLDALDGYLEEFAQIDRHYLRKENQLFPLLEKRGVSGPTEVMWAIHDDIRSSLKKARSESAAGVVAAADTAAQLVRAARDMIYKEERILFPMALETLSAEDWARVKRGEEEIGYAWIAPAQGWLPAEEAAKRGKGAEGGLIELDTGRLTSEQINLILKHLPVDISFIDENDEVAYYSQTPERIFPRSPGVIGRRVHNCHPPKSVPVVQKILNAFKAGAKDVAEFYLEMAGRFIHIRYYAVRDAEGKYRGTLEVSQDVTGIRGLAGEKRLLDWEDQ